MTQFKLLKIKIHALLWNIDAISGHKILQYIGILFSYIPICNSEKPTENYEICDSSLKPANFLIVLFTRWPLILLNA